MSEEYQEFENFLRGFEPRRPRTLPLVSASRYDRRRLAAAALILIAVGSSLWSVFRSRRTKFADQRPVTVHEYGAGVIAPPMMSCRAWVRSALDGRGEFDAQTNAIARRTLPRFDRADSSLRALAKE